MKLLRNIKHIVEKGALFIEYALILAFVAVIGAFFMSDNTMGASITGVFTQVSDLVEKSIGLEKKEDTLSKLLKEYAAVLSSSAMDHTGTQDKTTGIRYYSLGKEMASGFHEPNFGEKLRAAGIDAAYVGIGYSLTYSSSKTSESERVAFRNEHFLASGSSITALVLSTDGNTTWENGKSYNAVQYITSETTKSSGSKVQTVGAYRNIIVNVDSAGKKTYSDTAGNPIAINSATNDGGGWQQFVKE